MLLHMGSADGGSNTMAVTVAVAVAVAEAEAEDDPQDVCGRHMDLKRSANKTQLLEALRGRRSGQSQFHVSANRRAESEGGKDQSLFPGGRGRKRRPRGRRNRAEGR